MIHNHKSTRWHTHETSVFPFTAIIGQDLMKEALILNTINPSIGGVLIKGEKGTAKSTAARALTELLPHIDVVKGCPFHCDPDPSKIDELCTECRNKVKSGIELETTEQHMKIVTLPVSATEDRVVGTIDLKKALSEQKMALEPGILAEVNRGILYIDEVNLLDNHVADILLDAAAMGYNIIERESISFYHPARFILVGTMNPEEGDLRPQLLDRFGLTVDVRGVQDLKKRIAIIQARQEFDANKKKFKSRCESDQRILAEKIVHAKEILPKVQLNSAYLEFISMVCIQMGTDGHRADITIAKTSRTIAAFEQRLEVQYEDIKKAMILALPHRLRKGPFKNQKFDPDEFSKFLDDLKNEIGLENRVKQNDVSKNSESEEASNQDSEKVHETDGETKAESESEKKPDTNPENISDKDESQNQNSSIDNSDPKTKDVSNQPQTQNPLDNSIDKPIDSSAEKSVNPESAMDFLERNKDKYNFEFQPVEEKVFQIGAGISDESRKKILKSNLKNIIQRSKSRNKSQNSVNRQGKYVKYRYSRPGEKLNDLAFDATLRAAVIGCARNNQSLSIQPEHYRIKVRHSPTNVLIIFILDSSGSMSINKRMSAAKGAIYSLLEEIYIRKDKVCLISFSGDSAHLVLPPTNSIDMASELLEKIPTGGKTPLSAGLHKAIQIGINEFNTKGLVPLLVLLSDGKQNVPLYDSFEQDKEQLCSLLESHNLPLICIDTDMSRFNLGFAKDLSEKFNAIYYELDRLQAESVANIISHEYKEMTRVLDSA